MFTKYRKEPPRPPAPSAPPPAAPAAPAPQAPVRSFAKPLAAPPEDPKERKRKERLSQIKAELHMRLLDQLNLSALERASDSDLRAEIDAIAAEALQGMAVALNRDERARLGQELLDEVKGLGPLEPLLRDDEVNDILVNGPSQVFVERAGRLTLSDVTFRDEKHLLRIIDKIVSAVGRRVDESNPYVDARLKDGSRFNAMVPPIAVDGSLVSIRKFKQGEARDRRPRALRRLHRGHGRLPGGRRRLPAQRHRLGRHRLGQDHDAQRAQLLHRRLRADPDDRGHRRAPAPADPCRPHGDRAPRTSRDAAPSPSATA